MLLGHVLSFFPVTFRCLQLWCQGSVSHGECIVISYLGKHPCLANSPDFRPCGLSGLGLVASAAANRFAAKETEEDRAFRIHFACVLCIVPRQRQKPEATTWEELSRLCTFARILTAAAGKQGLEPNTKRIKQETR